MVIGASAALIAAAATTPGSSATSTPPPVSGFDLSGAWNGRYRGALSAPIDGPASGGHIQLGTVGSMAITYTGSALKSSMSGNNEVGASVAATGSWTATKA